MNDDSNLTPPASPPSAVPRRSALRYGLYLLFGSLAVCVATLYFFCPRFYLWRGVTLDIPELMSAPEINRAVYVLRQLHDPNVVIDHPSNYAINWRLFFPWLGHLLHLSDVAFLSLTFVGCWAAAGLCLHILTRETGNRVLALTGTISLCCTSWFFVSTGWLSYNDSWITFALTAVAAIRSRWILLIGCLVGPWIEERFIVLLPTAIALRSFFFANRDRPIKNIALDILTATFAIAPYSGVRLYSYHTGIDPMTLALLKDIDSSKAEYPLWRYFEATWAALRFNWFFVAVWAYLAWRQPPRWWSAIAVLGTLISIPLLHRLVPGDLHRNAGMFAPVALAGIVLGYRSFPKFTAKAVVVVAVINLILPAYHVITVFKYPVFGLFVEWDNAANNKSALLNPQYFNEIAVRLSMANQTEGALLQFDKALRVDPGFHTARINKAIILTTLKRYDEALIELDQVIASGEDHPEAHYARGVCREAKLDYRGAVADYGRALESPRKDWGFREETERLYKRLRGVGITPRTEDKSKDAKTESKK
jgi:tetratricopeptide (TPR) repeat protein